MLAALSTLGTERQHYPLFTEHLPALELSDGGYFVRFAHRPDELDAILRLRYEVFNLELNEGFESSHETQRDEDEFDAQCHHLMVLERKSGQVIGTYRMQTREMAQAGNGFYSAGEFDLSGLPDEVLNNAVELGRACVAKAHRNMRALLLLWHGLAAYLAHNRKRYLFGCCSLTSQDPAEGKRVMDYLEAHEHVHRALRVMPESGYTCYGEDFVAAESHSVKIPRLMKIYLTYGAKICGPPAIDRHFKTIDYLGLIDVQQLDPQTYRYFFH
jgi:putative hemolysin